MEGETFMRKHFVAALGILGMLGALTSCKERQADPEADAMEEAAMEEAAPRLSEMDEIKDIYLDVVTRDCGAQFGSQGECRNIRIECSRSIPLSEADIANGITFSAEIAVSLIARYGPDRDFDDKLFTSRFTKRNGVWLQQFTPEELFKRSDPENINVGNIRSVLMIIEGEPLYQGFFLENCGSPF